MILTPNIVINTYHSISRVGPWKARTSFRDDHIDTEPTRCYVLEPELLQGSYRFGRAPWTVVGENVLEQIILYILETGSEINSWREKPI